MAPACLTTASASMSSQQPPETTAGPENPCGLDAFAAAARDDFARLLTENGTTLLRLMLHISKKEQDERLQDRLGEPKSRATPRASCGCRRQWRAAAPVRPNPPGRRRSLGRRSGDRAGMCREGIGLGRRGSGRCSRQVGRLAGGWGCHARYPSGLISMGYWEFL